MLVYIRINAAKMRPEAGHDPYHQHGDKTCIGADRSQQIHPHGIGNNSPGPDPAKL
jgi:hypothetical protein